MNEQFIAILDSGIGGISLLKELEENLPNESFIYLGDNLNAPYGNKNRLSLLSLTIKNVDILKRYPLKAIVLGCNTLSVNIIKEIKDYSNINVFGIFPPVEKCMMSDKKTLLLSTISTAKKYKATENLHILGIGNLAEQIEKNMFNINNVNFAKSISEYSIGNFVNRKNFYNEIILGCTHYNFIKNQIYDHFQPQAFIDGAKNTINELTKFLKRSKSLDNNKRNSILFIGGCARINEKFYVKSGQNMKN